MARPARRIVNASPLILLVKSGQLELLRAGGPEIIVPEAVLTEIAARGPSDPIFQAVQQCGWLTRAPTLSIPPAVAIWNIGRGESSVLAQALATPDCETVLDDRQARRCAESLGIAVRGSVGVVLLAKTLGLIHAARPAVERLRQDGLYLTDELANQSLSLVGE